MYRHVRQQADLIGVTVEKSYVGEYATSLEMAGASLSILKVNDERLELLNAPAVSPFFEEV
jgi:dihydroxyacetone kinase/dihydroxyacetone kinase-like protein